MLKKFVNYLFALMGYIPAVDVQEAIKKCRPICNTQSGQEVNLLNPDVDTLVFSDIAHALGNAARYAGHSKFHYSVAQHCVLIAKAILDRTGDVNLAMAGLFHDAPEAYLTDIPRPFKYLLKGYAELEDAMEAAICAKFDIDASLFKQVKAWDMEIVVDEMAVLLPDAVCNNSHLEGLGVPIEKWSQERAAMEYGLMYHKLKRLQAAEAQCRISQMLGQPDMQACL